MNCNYCTKTFKTQAKLANHFTRPQHTMNAFGGRCQQAACVYIARTIIQLRTHVSRVHTIRNRATFICNQCDKSYKTQTGLTKHTCVLSMRQKICNGLYGPAPIITVSDLDENEIHIPELKGMSIKPSNGTGRTPPHSVHCKTCNCHNL